MADNYLENKMEQYRRGGAARETVRRRGRRVVVAGDDARLVLAEAARYAAEGCRVAVLAAPEGTPASVRAYPEALGTAVSLRRILHDWHEVDLLVVAGRAEGVAAELASQRALIPEALRSPQFAIIEL